MPSEHLVNDLATHVLNKHAKAMERAFNLFDDEHERFAFMITVVGSEITTLMATLAHANPMLASLPADRQFVAVMFMLSRALGYGQDGPPDVQGLSDIYAALHIYPEVRLRDG